MEKKRALDSWYRAVSLSLAAVFAAVGLVFLLQPGGVLEFFNFLARHLGMIESPQVGHQFYLVLAVAYMYAVTLLAWMMFRHPRDRSYPLLLLNAKISSSLLSFALFVLHQPYLVYLTNGIVDGAIGLVVLYFYGRLTPGPARDEPR